MAYADISYPDALWGYFLVDVKNDFVPLQELPVKWGQFEIYTPDICVETVYVCGLRVDSETSVTFQVKSWRFEFCEKEAQIFVEVYSNKDMPSSSNTTRNHWIKLESPLPDYERVCRSVLVCVNAFLFFRENKQATIQDMLDHIWNKFSYSFDPLPTEKDLVDNKTFVRKAICYDAELGKARELCSFLNDPLVISQKEGELTRIQREQSRALALCLARLKKKYQSQGDNRLCHMESLLDAMLKQNFEQKDKFFEEMLKEQKKKDFRGLYRDTMTVIVSSCTTAWAALLGSYFIRSLELDHSNHMILSGFLWLGSLVAMLILLEKYNRAEEDLEAHLGYLFWKILAFETAFAAPCLIFLLMFLGKDFGFYSSWLILVGVLVAICYIHMRLQR